VGEQKSAEKDVEKRGGKTKARLFRPAASQATTRVREYCSGRPQSGIIGKSRRLLRRKAPSFFKIIFRASTFRGRQTEVV